MSEKPVRQKIEKDALTAHRYKNWAASVNRELATLNELRIAMEQATDRLSYAYLEAREEQEELINSGFTKDQVDAVAKMPVVPVDAVAIIRTVNIAGGDGVGKGS